MQHAQTPAAYGKVTFPKLEDVPQIGGYQVRVTNTGSIDSDDVVLGFISPPGAGKNGIPLQTLWGFERVHVKAGETKTVWLYPALTELSTTALSGERTALPGDYSIWFGNEAASQHGMGYVKTKLRAVFDGAQSVEAA